MIAQIQVNFNQVCNKQSNKSENQVSGEESFENVFSERVNQETGNQKKTETKKNSGENKIVTENNEQTEESQEVQAEVTVTSQTTEMPKNQVLTSEIQIQGTAVAAENIQNTKMDTKPLTEEQKQGTVILPEEMENLETEEFLDPITTKMFTQLNQETEPEITEETQTMPQEFQMTEEVTAEPVISEEIQETVEEIIIQPQEAKEEVIDFLSGFNTSKVSQLEEQKIPVEMTTVPAETVKTEIPTTAQAIKQHNQGVQTFQNNNLENIETQMSERLTQLQNGDNVKLSLKLQPEELGKVEIQVEMVSGKMFAKIFTENNESKQLLNESLMVLKQNLEQKDITLEEMDVFYAETGSQNESQSGMFWEESQSEGEWYLNSFDETEESISLNTVNSQYRLSTERVNILV
jgi:flagellar hook-length control protein FliK